jgi:hypothetical protein
VGAAVADAAGVDDGVAAVAGRPVSAPHPADAAATAAAAISARRR